MKGKFYSQFSLQGAPEHLRMQSMSNPDLHQNDNSPRIQNGNSPPPLNGNTPPLQNGNVSPRQIVNPPVMRSSPSDQSLPNSGTDAHASSMRSVCHCHDSRGQHQVVKQSRSLTTSPDRIQGIMEHRDRTWSQEMRAMLIHNDRMNGIVNGCCNNPLEIHRTSSVGSLHSHRHRRYSGNNNSLNNNSLAEYEKGMSSGHIDTGSSSELESTWDYRYIYRTYEREPGSNTSYMTYWLTLIAFLIQYTVQSIYKAVIFSFQVGTTLGGIILGCLVLACAFPVLLLLVPVVITLVVIVWYAAIFYQHIKATLRSILQTAVQWINDETAQTT